MMLFHEDYLEKVMLTNKLWFEVLELHINLPPGRAVKQNNSNV